MPWQTPTLEETRKLNRDFIIARLQNGATLPNSALRVLADSNAGLAYLTLLYLDWLGKQLLPDTAETEWLERHAKIWLDGRKAASYAEGSAVFTGILGVTIPSGTRLAVNNNGVTVQYQTTASGVLNGAPPTATVPITAITPGAAGNVDDDTALTLQTAVSGADSSASALGLAGGADAETDDDLRIRVLQRIRKPPQGGDADDYVAWALEVPGVTRAWCSPNELGPGTVTIRFMMDALRADDDGFPGEDDVEAVQAYIDERRPVAMLGCYVRAPSERPVSFTLAGLSPDNGTIRANIEASVSAMIKDRSAPARAVNGIRVGAQTIYASWINEAISQASGVEHFTPVTGDHTMSNNGKLAVLGTITYA